MSCRRCFEAAATVALGHGHYRCERSGDIALVLIWSPGRDLCLPPPRVPSHFYVTFITRGGEGREDKNKDRKLREAKAEARKRGLVEHSCARVGRKDVVGKVKGVEVMGVLVAARGARERGGRRLEVEVDSKR